MRHRLRARRGQAATTCLITGASSGIGAAFARRLAVRGHHLILTARRADLLEQLAAELRQRHEVQVEVVTADLSRQEGLDAVAAAAQAAPLELLINNAGFGVRSLFAPSELQKQRDMIAVHVTAPMQLCHAALPAMLQRRRGGIINVSSVAVFFPLPGSANYAATKAYLVTLSQALRSEAAGSGVKIQALCPGFTHSGFHETAEYEGFNRSQVPRALWMSSDQVVSASLRALPRNTAVCIPGLQYKLLVAAARNSLTGPLVLKRLQGEKEERGRSEAAPGRGAG